MPIDPETAKNINKQFDKNNLTFSSNGVFAHFLGRNSRLDIDNVTADNRVDHSKISSGIYPDGDILHKGVTFSGADSTISQGFQVKQLDKALTNLTDQGYSNKDIASMSTGVSEAIYGNSVLLPLTEKHITRVKDLLSDDTKDTSTMDALNSHMFNDSDSEYPRAVNNSDWPAIVSLGNTKQDFFADLFTTTDKATKDTNVPQAESHLAEMATTLQKHDDLGGTLLKRKDYGGVQRMMNLGC